MNSNPTRYLRFLFLLAFLSLLQACSSDDCSQSCENNGIVTIDCACSCPDGFAGESCEVELCTIECQNNGTVTSDCTCDCSDRFTGPFCEQCVPSCNMRSVTDLWISENGSREANDNIIELPEKHLLTGLGFNSTSTLVAYGRELLEDCSLGEQLEFRAGSNPTGSQAVSYIVPDGHVVTGVGYGESQDIYRLVVNYSEILFDDDCDMYLGPEKLYDNQADRSVEVWLKISASSYDTRHHAFGGIALKFSNSFNRQVQTELREVFNI